MYNDLIEEDSVMKKMYVYSKRPQTYKGIKFHEQPIVVESNLDYAIPYWTQRKRNDSQIYWEIK